MKAKTRDKLMSAWDWCDINDKSTEFMIQFMHDTANVGLDTVINFIQRTTPEDRVKWGTEHNEMEFAIKLSDTFRGFNHGKGNISITTVFNNVNEARPIEIHLKEDGALDNRPSFAIIMVDLQNNAILGQITLDMFNKGCKDIGYQLIKLKS